MTAHAKTPAISAALRRAVDEWLAQGYVVEIHPDGSLRVEPRRNAPAPGAFDLVDFRR